MADRVPDPLELAVSQTRDPRHGASRRGLTQKPLNDETPTQPKTKSNTVPRSVRRGVLGGAATARFVLVFHAQWVATSDGTNPVRYTITRLSKNSFAVQCARKDASRGWVAFKAGIERTMTAAMEWCEDVAREDGSLARPPSAERAATAANRATNQAAAGEFAA